MADLLGGSWKTVATVGVATVVAVAGAYYLNEALKKDTENCVKEDICPLEEASESKVIEKEASVSTNNNESVAPEERTEVRAAGHLAANENEEPTKIPHADVPEDIGEEIFRKNVVNPGQVDEKLLAVFQECKTKAEDALNRGNLIEAEDFYSKMSQYARELFGSANVLHLSTLYVHGTIAGKVGKFDVAEKALLECKRHMEDGKGKEMPDYAVLLVHLGDLYKDFGFIRTAGSYFDQAITTALSVEPEFAEASVRAYLEGAVFHLGAGNYEKAEEYAKILDPVFKKAPQAVGERAEVAFIHAMYNLFKAGGDPTPYDEVLSAISNFKDLMGKESVRIIFAYYDVAVLCKKLGLLNFAASAIKNCCSLCEKAIDPAHPTYARAFALSGLIDNAHNKHDSAKGSFEIAANLLFLHGYQGTSKPKNPQCIMALAEIQRIYTDTPAIKAYLRELVKFLKTNDPSYPLDAQLASEMIELS
eukprot:TRINITY_DN3878_c0_g1_i4.p1 TRINITY_DN3878_c0_g1~~TRINITY_DN3878_c0_g1_i4.p1  ORF type:complete len:476 (-),score=141.66 TRINITY_DN3878_c0_g1_i4:34-1461(-)